MGKAELYSVISKCFAPVDQTLWDELTSYTHWSEFLEACRLALSGDEEENLEPETPARGETCPLQDFLTVGEIEALYKPPTYAEKKSFAARHFTGGLPTSACPIESLYVVWMQEPARETPFPQVKGLYLSDSAWYMQDLIERMGMKTPPGYRACPDHLSLELDLLAVLERSGLSEEARLFLYERFQWLTAYRNRLLQVTDDVRFYVGLIDILIGLYSNEALAGESP